MNDRLNTRFRSRSESVDQDLEKTQQKLKDITSHRKTSMNQSLNFSIRLSKEYIEFLEKKIQDHQQEIEKHEKEISSLRNKIKRCTDF